MRGTDDDQNPPLGPSDEQWSELRDDIGRRLRPPMPTELADRAVARQRQRASRMTGIAVLVVAVVAIPVLGSLAGRGQSGPSVPGDGPSVATSSTVGVSVTHPNSAVDTTGAPPGTSNAAPTPASSLSASDNPTTDDPTTRADYRPERSILAADFADPTHGFAMISSCPGNHLPCTNSLEVTTDGLNWTRRSLPPERGVGGPDPAVRALGGDRVLYFLPGSRVEPSRNWFSPNAGRTWKPAAAVATGTVSQLPLGARYEPSCFDYAGCASKIDLRLPDGSLTSLSTLRGFYPDSMVQVDATTWLAPGVTDFPSTTAKLARSIDGGRTWSVTSLPSDGSRVFTTLLSRAGSIWYATVIGETAAPNAKNGLLAIDRSTDNGRTWTSIWVSDAKRQPVSSSGIPVITADGQVSVVTDEARCFTSSDGGRNFTEIGCTKAGRPTTWISWERGMYSTWRYDAPVLVTSTNGRNWLSARL